MQHFLTLSHIDVFAGGILLALSTVLFMIPIPKEKQWHRFRCGRDTLAAAYAVLSVLMIVNGILGDDSPSATSGMITLIISYYQALLYTKISVMFVKPRSFGDWQYKAPLLVCSAYSAALAVCHVLWPAGFGWMFPGGIGLYTLLLVYCSVVFRRNYKEGLTHIEYVYDEDMHYRLRWVKGCFYSALVVGIMAWCMIVWHDYAPLNITGIGVFTLYYLFMIGYFLRYVNKYSFMLNSDNAKETAQLEAVKPAEVIPAPVEIPVRREKLEERLEEWKARKGYRDNAKMIDEIVDELRTTRRSLNEYMMRVHGCTFRTWRNRLRIEDAKRMLAKSDIRASEIYLNVGYTDRSNFHRQFTEIVGMTPLQYREKHKVS